MDEGSTGYDKFSKVWYEQGKENIDYYNCKQPKNNTIGDPSIYFMPPDDFYTGRQLAPTAGAVFIYDSVMALGLAACELYEKKGDEYFNGEELFEGFVSQSFEGASGMVKIKPETTSRDPTSAFFVLYNTNGEPDGKGGTVFSVNTVSHTTPNPDSASVTWTSSYRGNVFMYSDGTSTPPPPLPLPTVDMNHLTTGIRAVGLTIAALTFALGLFFWVWTKRNREERVVKASQPQFLYMICMGAIILGSTIIPLSIDDSVATKEGCDKACMSIPWLFNYGFVTVFSALFAKTWRLNKVMRNANNRKKMKVQVKDAMKPWFVLMILNTIVLVVWHEVDPWHWERVMTGSVDQFDRSIESYGHCTSKNAIPYLVVLFIINFALVILANYQAYHARNLSTEFSESKYISIVMASVFQAIVIGLPLTILVSQDPNARFIVKTIIVGAMSLSTLCLMFIPKMWSFRRKETVQEENPNVDETGVERANITEVKVDLDESRHMQRRGAVVAEDGVMTNFWNRAVSYYNKTGNSADEIIEDEEADVITARSIFVGTLMQRNSTDTSM